MFRTVLAVVFLGYYWTGLNMVVFHGWLPAFEQPAYVRGNILARTFAGAIWPYTCLLNRELGWFFSSFVGLTVAVGLMLALLTHWLSWFWAIMIVGLIQFVKVPVISPLFSLLITLPAAAVARMLARFFHFSIPASMERFAK